MNFRIFVESMPDADWSRISQKTFLNYVTRYFNRNRGWFYEEEPPIRSPEEWLRREEPHNIGMVLDSEYDFYQVIGPLLPDDATAADLIQAYKDGKLPPESQMPARPGPIALSSTGFSPERQIWQSQEPKPLPPERLRELWALSSQRPTKKNREQVEGARRELWFQMNLDSEIMKKLGVGRADISKWLRGKAGTSRKDFDRHSELNRGVPLEHQWVGSMNASFLGKTVFSHEDIGRFVKEIDVSGEAYQSYSGKSGEQLRKYIMNTFLAIDTGISYSDLSFKIKNLGSTPLGVYNSIDKVITISTMAERTVAHEIGHYLDDKLGVMFGFAGGDYLSNSSHAISVGSEEMLQKGIPKEQLAWGMRFHDFMEDIVGSGDNSSAYKGSRHEVFARFIARFCAWTAYGRNGSRFDTEDQGDKFNDRQYRAFVRLLQEKSFLDAKKSN